VYLNDGEPALFKDMGTSYGAANRPATKAGGFRVFRGIDEIHEVENTSELPSHFLRVELKTDTKDVSTLKGASTVRWRHPGAETRRVMRTWSFSNWTVSRFSPGRGMRVAAAAFEPTLLIALGDAKLRASDGYSGNSRAKLPPKIAAPVASGALIAASAARWAS
jgi:hypothetical protein